LQDGVESCIIYSVVIDRTKSSQVITNKKSG